MDYRIQAMLYICWLSHIFICPCIASVCLADEEKLAITLNDALQIGEKSNPDIRRALIRFEAEKANFYIEVSPASPEFYLENAGMPTMGSFIRNYGERWIGFIQSVEFPLRWYFRGKMQYRQIEAARKEYESVTLSVLEQIREGYYRVLARDKCVTYCEQNLRLLGDFAEKAKIRYKLGEATRLEVMRANVEYSRAEGNLHLARNEHVLAISNLKYLLHCDSDLSLVLLDTLGFTTVDYTLDGLLEIAAGKHPDIDVAKMQLEGSKAMKNYANMSFLPDFYAGLFRQKFGGPGDEDRWASQVGFSIPLWFLMKERNEIKSAERLKEESEVNLMYIRNTIMLELEKAYLDLRTTERRVKLFKTGIVSEAEEIFRIAAESYQEGAIGYIELLEAQRTLLEARREYIDALYEYQKSLAALIRAAGGSIP